MKKTLIAVAVFSVFSMSANAAGLFGVTNNNQTYNTPVANSSAVAGAASNATGGSVKSEIKNTNTNLNSLNSTQGQGQQQSANNEGNTQSINVEASKSYRPPVSSAFAPTIFPTAPCMGSSSVGASGTLFSISGGTTWTSEECMILETARSFDQAGDSASGTAVRCQGKWAKIAPACKAVQEVTVTQDQAIVYSDIGYYSTVTNPLGK